MVSNGLDDEDVIPLGSPPARQAGPGVISGADGSWWAQVEGGWWRWNEGERAWQPATASVEVPPSVASAESAPGADAAVPQREPVRRAAQTPVRPPWDPAAPVPRERERGLFAFLRRGRQVEEERRRLVALARTPVTDPPHRVAVTTAKGGEGKTTTTLFLASQLGLLRHDRLLAVECNPHHGTFRQRVRTVHPRGVKELLRELDGLERDEDLTYELLARHVNQQHEARLEILASPMDPADLDALSEAEYRRVLRALYRHYGLVLLDTGTGLRDAWTSAILGEIADQVVVVAQASRDGAALADHTLDYLAARRGAAWVRSRVVVVVNRVEQGGVLHPKELVEWFGARARRALTVRYDRHLAAGGPMDWAALEPRTREDYLALAAELGSGFNTEPGGGR